MARQYKEYRQLGCRDFGADCDFMVWAETVDGVTKYGYDHGRHVHGKCRVSRETDRKMKSLIKNIWV